MSLSVENLCDLLVRSTLVTAGEAGAIYQRWRAEGEGATSNVELFQKWLVARQYVTGYQVELLVGGRADHLFLGPYKILDRIGRGCLAGAYKAVHRLGQVVAIKVLPPAKAKDPVAVARFQREARRAMRPTHPNVVRTFQVGEANGQHYLVVEYLEGETLRDVLNRRGKLPPAEGVRLIHQALLGLQHFHEQGLECRDLEPDYLLLVPGLVPGQPDTTLGSTVKILDGDLARSLADEAALAEDANTQRVGEGLLPRTPAYIAAEQTRAACEGDIRSGIYSLGCLLYHALAGQPPFPDTSPITPRNHHAEKAVRPLREFSPAVPEELEQVVNRMLAKDAAHRYPTPERAAQALQVFLAPDAGPPPSAAEPYLRSYLTWLETGAGQLRPGASDSILEAGVDENVQFTVYRPRAVQPQRWYPLLAFAHVSERRPDAPPEEPDPVEELQRQVQQLLGSQAVNYQDVTQDSKHPVPRERELTFVPQIPGVQFNPPRRTFLWLESIHREDFRLCASPALDGKTARGSFAVFLGNLLLAEVTLGIRVDSRQAPAERAAPLEGVTAAAYRKIFASYSHKDLAIVEEVERYARVVGDTYVRDWVHLRAGEAWDERLKQLIGEADVFQLFWSHNAMNSDFVEREWRYALSLNRPRFVRPTYWEEPLPESAERGLPPEELRRLHFHRLFPNVVTGSRGGDPRQEAEAGSRSEVSGRGGGTNAEVQPAEKLHILLDVTAELTQTLSIEQILPRLMDRLFQVFKQADRGFIILTDEQAEKLVPRVLKTRVPNEESTARFSRRLVNSCLEHAQALLIEDATADKRFDLSQGIADCRIRSVMCAPLVMRSTGKAFGVIQLDTQDRHKKFTQEDLKLLLAVAGQASMALESAQLHASLVARAGLERDLQLAHQVQMTLLPEKLPDVPGYEFFAHSEMAREVGGDYYDFIPLPDGRLAVMLGDVAGKGVPAALLASKVSERARYYFLSEPSPSAAMGRINNWLCGAGFLDRFVMLVVFSLDPVTHTVTLVNAGHSPPLVYRNATGAIDEAMPREQVGFPLGVPDAAEYQPCEFLLQPGDCLLAFTDGITEATSRQRQMFSMEGVYAALQAGPPTPKAMGERLVKAVKRFSGGLKPYDDITVVCFGRVL
jgi:serine phosphatase RsbU (regulator of sigma subunit)/serine/threonine protein kinase